MKVWLVVFGTWEDSTVLVAVSRHQALLAAAKSIPPQEWSHFVGSLDEVNAKSCNAALEKVEECPEGVLEAWYGDPAVLDDDMETQRWGDGELFTLIHQVDVIGSD